VKNWKWRLGVSFVATTAIGLGWACSDTNNGTLGTGTSSSTGTGTSSNGGGEDSGGSASNSSSSGSGGGGGAVANVQIAGLIDDMENIQSDGPGTLGSWYTYSDRSIANSEPPEIIANAPGFINPVEGASFPPGNTLTDGGTAPTLLLPNDGSTLPSRECTGGGEKTWGAGFGLDLIDNPPDGGNVIPFNVCIGEAGIFNDSPDAGAVGIPAPFDASAYTGFAFWAVSLTGSNYTVQVHVDDDQTSPWGGQCGVCVPAGVTCSAPHEAGTTEGCQCSDNFYENETFTPTWKQFVIRWTDTGFTANHYSGEGALTFHPKSMYNIHFQFTTTSGTATKPFDVAVALLQWVSN